MFFIVSKVLFFLLSPLVWIIGLITYSIFGSNPKWKKKTLIYSLIILLFFSNSFICAEFMRLWETPTVKYEQLKTYDYGIVLGGMISYNSEDDRIMPLRNIDRLLQAIKLYKIGKINKIFLSAGSVNLVYPDFKEGIFLKNYLVDIGIPECDIEMEIKSLNTHQNAEYTAESILKPEKDQSFLLITSAYHMKRAKACYDKVGINADVFPVDIYSGSRKYDFNHLFVPDIGSFNSWVVLIKEWIGYIVYYIVGYI